MLIAVHLSGETYAREIARAWRASLTPVQKQLEKLERGGILRSRTAGRTRLYSLDPGCPLHRSIERLLQRSIDLITGESTSAFIDAPPIPRRPGRKRKRLRTISRRRVMI